MFTGASRRDVFFFYYLVVCVYVYKLISKKTLELSEAGGEKSCFSHSVILSVSFE